MKKTICLCDETTADDTCTPDFELLGNSWQIALAPGASVLQVQVSNPGNNGGDCFVTRCRSGSQRQSI